MGKNIVYIASAAVVGAIGVAGVVVIAKKAAAAKKRKRIHDASHDKVILHQLHRGKHSPSCSPFPVKLETFLRIAKIPYEVDFTDPYGPKGKTPWITVDGIDIADSHFCIEHLSRHPEYSANVPDTWLSPEQASQAVAIRALVEDRLYWEFVELRYKYTKNFNLVLDAFGMKSCFERFMFSKVVPPLARKQAFQQGMGRHTEKEVESLTIQDLRALSYILGNKMFLFGDQVSSIDCCAFGMLMQYLWNDPSYRYKQLFEGELKNLKEYCIRMKDAYWGDWKELGLDEPE